MLQRYCIKCIRPWAFYKNEYSSTRSKQSCFWASYILAVLSQLTFFSYHYIIHIVYSKVDVEKLGKKLLSHWHSSNCIIQNKTNMNVTSINYPKYHRVRDELYKSRLQEIVAQDLSKTWVEGRGGGLHIGRDVGPVWFSIFLKRKILFCAIKFYFFLITIKPNSKVMVS